MLHMRYEFHFLMTFQGLEIAISCFLLWHHNLCAICSDENCIIKLNIISNIEKHF